MPLQPLSVTLSDGQKVAAMKRFRTRYAEELVKLDAELTEILTSLAEADFLVQYLGEQPELVEMRALHALIASWADKKLLLPRAMGELYESIRDFLVAEAEPGGIVGCAALHIDTDKIAELKALAVADAVHGRGIGRSLVEGCCAE